jgi:uncharacterized protein YhaN
MKLDKLIIAAYGHFTDRVLDFSSSHPGLHIIHGPNEAGKSTALRALKGLFFGIPERTADNFRHSYDQLLIGGVLSGENGGELTFYRRKKRIGDLLGPGMEPLDSACLMPFLAGMEPALFDSLYGIDQETLVSGGRDILEQKGDVGQALFAAGAGLSSLHGIIADLEREYAEIFKSSGSKPELNRAIKEYTDCLKETRTLSLSSSEWEQSRRAHEITLDQLADCEGQMRLHTGELVRLKRLSRALPKLAVKKDLEARLAECHRESRLPEDFPEQVEVTLRKRDVAAQKLNQAHLRLAKLVSDRQEFSLCRDIPDQAETIDSLYQRLGAERQARKDRPGLYEKMIRARSEAESLLRRIAPECGLSEIDSLKGVLGRRQNITRLGNRFGAVELDLRKGEELLKRTAAERAKAEQRLSELADVPDPAPLSTALTLAIRGGDPDAALRRLTHECLAARSAVEKRIAALGLWQGKPEQLVALALPSGESVSVFFDAFLESDRTLRECRQKIRELEGELEQVQCDIASAELTGSLVTAVDLSLCREGRDLRWQLVKRAWLAREEVASEAAILGDDTPLPEAYEKWVRSADDLSDRLRREAERVHSYAGLCALRDKLTRQLDRLRESEQKTGSEAGELAASWQQLWQGCGIQPGSPREMRDWLDRCSQVRRDAEELLVQEARIMPLTEQRSAVTVLLNHELAQLGRGQRFPGEELSPLQEYATRIYDELSGINTERARLQDEIGRLASEYRSAEEAVAEGKGALEAWRIQWRDALHGLWLSEESAPGEAMEALENLRNCLEQRDLADGFQLRIDEIDRHARIFTADVAALVAAIAPELDALPAEQAVVKLQSMLTESRKTQSVLEKIQHDCTLVEDEIRSAELEQQSARDAVEALQERTGSVSDEDLREMERSFRSYMKQKEELAQATRSLVELSEGIPLHTIEQQAEDINPDELPARIETLEKLVSEDLGPRIRTLSEKKGAGRIQLDRMDGSGKAAEMLEKAEAALTKIRRLAGRYVRLKVAGQILKREIEQYRREHQDPVLRIASRYFTELTCGAYEGLKTDLDDAGQPLLVGATRDSRSKTVERMSSGTRDQLYLALRLATLEWRLEKQQPMPFIADDLLVNFDDVRSAATLRALSDLAVKNQVILFTHHRQIVTIAEGLGRKDLIFIHEL